MGQNPGLGIIPVGLVGVGVQRRLVAQQPVIRHAVTIRHQTVDAFLPRHADQGFAIAQAGRAIIFGEAFDKPGRIKGIGHLEHEGMGIFVKQDDLAGVLGLIFELLARLDLVVRIGRDGRLTGIAGLVPPHHVERHARPCLFHVELVGNKIEPQLRQVLAGLRRHTVEAGQHVAILFQFQDVVRGGLGRHVAENDEMIGFCLDPLRSRDRRRACQHEAG